MRTFGLLLSAIIITPMSEAVADDDEGLPGPGPVLTDYGRRLEEQRGLRKPRQQPKPQRPARQRPPQQPQQTARTRPPQGGGAVGARGRLLGEQSTPSQEPPQQEARDPKAEFQALLKTLDETRTKLDEAQDELSQNELIQEQRLVKLLGKLITNPSLLSDSARAIESWLKGDDDAAAKLPPEVAKMGLQAMEQAIKTMADRAKDRRTAARLRRLQQRLRRIRKRARSTTEAYEKARDEIKSAADLLTDFTPEKLAQHIGEELKGKLEDAIKDKAKDALAGLIGKKALGGLLSIGLDLNNFFDALGTISDIDDLRDTYDEVLKAAIRKGGEAGLNLPTTGGWQENDAYFPSKVEALRQRLQEAGVTHVTVRPRLTSWDAEKGEWVTTDLPFRPGHSGRVPVASLTGGTQGEARTPKFQYTFPPVSTPGYVTIEVDGGPAGDANVIAGVMNPPRSAGAR